MAKRKAVRITFVFVVVTAVIVTSIVSYGLMAALTSWESLVLLMGTLILVWAIVFTILEMYRLARLPKNGSGQAVIEDEDDLDFPRTVVVQPPTGEPCPHHEYYPESPGLDQGQLTSQLPGSTLWIGELMDIWRRKKRLP
jgi:hypothetical protein